VQLPQHDTDAVAPPLLLLLPSTEDDNDADEQQQLPPSRSTPSSIDVRVMDLSNVLWSIPSTSDSLRTSLLN